MKKTLLLFFTVIMTSVFVGCSSDDDFTPPNYVAFEGKSLSATVEQGGSQTMEVTVYTANQVGNDRTFNINIDGATTLESSVFNVPQTVVVPGGTNEGTFTVELTDDNLANSGGKLVLSFEGQENLYISEPLEINVSKFCPVNVDDYVGTYEGTDSWGYPTEVEIFYNEDNELMINGLLFGWFQDWWGEVITKNEPVRVEIDGETGAITIAEQFYLESTYEGEAQTPYNLKGTGTINACEKTVAISPVLVQGGDEIDGSAWGPVFKETISVTESTGDTDGGDTDGGDTDGGDTDGGDTDGGDTDGGDTDGGDA